MFSPDGSVEGVYHSAYPGIPTVSPPTNVISAYVRTRVTEPIFLLIGEWEQSGARFEWIGSQWDANPNYEEDPLKNWQKAEKGRRAASSENALWQHGNVKPLGLKWKKAFITMHK